MSVQIISIIIILIIAWYFIFGRKTNIPNAQADAQRLANLLVAEIRLFESYKIERGLKNNNLYTLLRYEIEAARKKYKKSFPNVEAEIYFDAALVEVLASGDKNKLGAVSTALNK